MQNAKCKMQIADLTQRPSATEPQPKKNRPQKNTKIAKKKQHKFFSLGSLRSFAAKILLELHDFTLLQYTLFPRLRWEKEASQHVGGKQLIFASTNMLVLVCGLQCEGAARPAATKEFEQEHTEKTEAGEFCQKCPILGNSPCNMAESRIVEKILTPPFYTRRIQSQGNGCQE